ncbi:probable disease resistance protein At1g15890 [Durio zibethinus]|uniref:Probable disease resistance protein At1g15890 n=1 Tax=Durio zibethinus TaxID=66656 RepID=A0A6P6A7K6_DURZI|nr:probable disease resistance protein At1g15890 [Durio zibethinus]
MAEATSLKNELSQITIMRNKPPTVHRSHRWNNDVRIVNLPSLKNHVETLIDWLKEERFKRIYVRGPLGIGKTTIMKIVYNNVYEYRQFDYTFRVTLTDESRISRDIQEVIWNCLGMRMDENDHLDQRAAVISEKLKEKNVLFLDEVSSVVNLEEVGIKRNHEHGKVVFACRDKYDGHIDSDMIVQRLCKKDARKLFWESVGSDLEKKREIKRTAEQIIDLCGGMPSILSLIGKQLERKDIAQWRDMKRNSKQPWQELEEYYRSLKLVYNRFTEADYKRCLLYWAIFPFSEEINRDYIIDCWTAEQFLECQRLGKLVTRAYYTR